ncbi:hypothetical protein BDY24DRAFT_400484 [Mrakia frigida]|uniref:RNA recognition motif domain-containing protein n=1 Tax=Mrakia frigida TaxID=29902 RepID=UPI003FCC1AC6
MKPMISTVGVKVIPGDQEFGDGPSVTARISFPSSQQAAWAKSQLEGTIHQSRRIHVRHPPFESNPSPISVPPPALPLVPPPAPMPVPEPALTVPMPTLLPLRSLLATRSTSAAASTSAPSYHQPSSPPLPAPLYSPSAAAPPSPPARRSTPVGPSLDRVPLSRLPSSEYTLFVAGIDPYASSNDIESLFSKYGPVIRTRAPKRKPSRPAFIFVTFQFSADARKAREALDGQTISNRQLSVVFAKRDAFEVSEVDLVPSSAAPSSSSSFARTQSGTGWKRPREEEEEDVSSSGSAEEEERDEDAMDLETTTDEDGDGDGRKKKEKAKEKEKEGNSNRKKVRTDERRRGEEREKRREREKEKEVVKEVGPEPEPVGFTLYVKNLHHSFTVDEFRSEFSVFGEITGVRISRSSGPSSSSGAKNGHVTFKHLGQAKEAATMMRNSRLRDQLITVAFSDQIAPRQSLPDPKPRPTPPPAAPFPPPSSTQREYSSRGAVFDSQASVRETDPKSGLSATSGSSKRREQKRAREKEEAAVRRRNSDGSSLRYPGLGTGGDGMTDW